jgi:hypothetical protein
MSRIKNLIANYNKIIDKTPFSKSHLALSASIRRDEK